MTQPNSRSTNGSPDGSPDGSPSDGAGGTATAAPPAPPAAPPQKRRMKRSTRIALLVVAVLALIAAAGFTTYYFLDTRHYVSTDNAQVDGDKIDINAPVSGYLIDWRARQGADLRLNEVVGR